MKDILFLKTEYTKIKGNVIMKENNLVSIIVPIYKVEKYMERCVESIITQTYKNIEIILIDDGSPDKCPQICDHYMEKDKRIKVIHQQNKGLSGARNSGLRIMTGQYVMFVDSDDVIHHYMVEHLVGVIKKYNADMVICNFEEFNNINKIVMNIEEDNSVIKSKTEIYKELFSLKNKIQTAWGKLYRSEMFKEFSYPEDKKFAEDMFVIHKLIDKAEKIVWDNRVYYYYFQGGVSLVRSEFSINKLLMVDAAKEWNDFINNKYSYLEEFSLACYFAILSSTYIEILLNNREGIYDKYLDLYDQEIKKNFTKYKGNKVALKNEKIKIYLLKYKLSRICVLLYILNNKKRGKNDFHK
jgi:glycosyltransferase involved in cell wall biosynthesis